MLYWSCLLSEKEKKSPWKGQSNVSKTDRQVIFIYKGALIPASVRLLLQIELANSMGLLMHVCRTVQCCLFLFF